MKIDVIIPTYKPGKELFDLLDRLGNQSLSVQRVILMNTERAYFDRLTRGMDFEMAYPFVKVIHVKKKEFDHGGTRRLGVQNSDADVFVMLTQDAMPVDALLIEQLTKNLSGKVAVAYGRQLPRRDCGVLERISRQFNYPAKSRIKGQKDLKALGIKTFFCSNVCAAYRRDVYEKLGGFVERTIFNEDMIYAGTAVMHGYQIAYEAEARVIHSHNYSCIQQFHRNFDLGVSQAQYPQVFESVRSESEGKKLVKSTILALRDRGQIGKIPYFLLQCCFKYAGYLLGKHYQMLPKCLILLASDNKAYWKKKTKLTQKRHKMNTKENYTDSISKGKISSL